MAEIDHDDRNAADAAAVAVAGEGEPSSRRRVAFAVDDDDDDQEGDVCRICRNRGDGDNPLRYPCACSGSIKFVHQDCLLQWLDHSNSRQCEVCKHAFSFSPVYAPNAPARLSFQELLVGVGMKACHVFQFILRLAFVLAVWLVIIPFITYWLWRLAFVKSFSEAQTLFISHFTTQSLFSDCIYGFLLSAVIVFIFLGATSLRDYIRHLREFGANDGERDDGVRERQGVRGLRRIPGFNRIPIVDANEDAGDGQGIANAGEILQRDAENVAARLERLEAQVEQILDGLDDADGAEDVPFDELVGMQGPVFHLVENAITVLASNAIFIVAVIFVPFSLGRIVLYCLSWFFSSATSPMLGKVVSSTESAISMASITLHGVLTVVMGFSFDSHDDSIIGHIFNAFSSWFNTAEIIPATQIESKPVAPIDMPVATSYLSDLATLIVGYTFVFFMICFYVGSITLIRYFKGEQIAIGRLYGMSIILEAVPSLFRKIVAGIKHLITLAKVTFLLFIELGVFPLMCGCWLDVCSLKMFGTTITERFEFFKAFPLASLSIHWIVGIIYMLQISIFVSLLRGVLRHGVLYFLRDPADPNYNPFRDLIDDPVYKHARRVLLSVVVYGSLIVMLVFLPIKLAMRFVPSMFPLDITMVDPFTEIPVDVLLLQVCIPFAIDHFKPRATVKAILHYWFVAVGWALGLTEYLLPRTDENVPQENLNVQIERQGRDDVGQQHGQHLIARVGADNNERRAFAFENDVDEESEDDQTDSERYAFAFRIVLLLVLAWMTLLVFNATMIIVPTLLGRLVFNSIPRLPITHGIKCNDLLSFGIGFYLIWGTACVARYTVGYVRSRRVRQLVVKICKWAAIVLKSLALLSIWIFVIPVLIGLLFDLLVIVPLRVPIDESPVFLWYQDWALGLIFLKIWTRLVMLEQMAPLVDESWRRKLTRVREDGFSRLRVLWVLHEIIIPIVRKLLTALCVPYVFARGVFPALGYSLVVNSAIYRFAWLGYLTVGACCFCARRLHVWFTNLHNSIRDDRYLIGKMVHNFGEESPAQGGDGAISQAADRVLEPRPAALLRLRRH